MIEYTKEIITKIDPANKGYVYFIDVAHPLATGNSGRVYLHRHVMSIKLGRWINTEEHVHHKDENILNNSPVNLEVLSSSEHAKLHNVAEQVEMTCPICGKLFDVSIGSMRKRKTCSIECVKQYRTKVVIDKDELEYLMWHLPAIEIAKIYGLSDKGVTKKAKSMGCIMPPPYFHNKSESFKEQERLKNNI